MNRVGVPNVLLIARSEHNCKCFIRSILRKKDLAKDLTIPIDLKDFVCDTHRHEDHIPLHSRIRDIDEDKHG